jgi:hypothetical protein
MNLNLVQGVYILDTLFLWQARWNYLIVADYKEGTHRLGIAKENLKEMLFPTYPTEHFNEAEINAICDMIGEWYFKWKKFFVDKEKQTNNFNLAVKDLQLTLLNEENDG